MKEVNEFELIVSQPKNPFWKTIVASLFFTIAIYLLISIFLQFHFSKLSQDEVMMFDKNIIITMICFVGAIYFSIRVTIMIDVDKEKLISRYFLGLFSFNTTTKIPELQYLSITKNTDDIYMINLWYENNKRFNMCYSEEKEKTFKFAEMVAIKLDIDLLDATEKGNSQWVDKTKV